ncbi:MAG: TraB/GumN family protein [Opitutales bacterium]|nr:TraB/GumN family protein [Opitutales bacterium]
MKIANLFSTIFALVFLGQSFLSAEPEDRGMVWKVESPTATVYLVGSVHILSFDNYPLPAPYESAYEASEKVVFELNMRCIFSRETSYSATILPSSRRHDLGRRSPVGNPGKFRNVPAKPGALAFRLRPTTTLVCRHYDHHHGAHVFGTQSHGGG